MTTVAANDWVKTISGIWLNMALVRMIEPCDGGCMLHYSTGEKQKMCDTAPEELMKFVRGQRIFPLTPHVPPSMSAASFSLEEIQAAQEDIKKSA